MTTTDLRWENVWAELRPYERSAYDIEADIRTEPMTVVWVEVLFEGIRFTSRQLVENSVKDDAAFDLLGFTLDFACIKIDEMLIENGFPPYEIKDA